MMQSSEANRAPNARLIISPATRAPTALLLIQTGSLSSCFSISAMTLIALSPPRGNWTRHFGNAKVEPGDQASMSSPRGLTTMPSLLIGTPADSAAATIESTKPSSFLTATPSAPLMPSEMSEVLKARPGNSRASILGPSDSAASASVSGASSALVSSAAASSSSSA
ncbi:hypothetical protein-signal peptide prediction [Rhodopirellula baltica SH 1]|uniref:Uncharacterized protein n=1 Tax=Rhodopirellula baltica (strain DSM 10527 / NCIMB 13988 / SH1) TaxID=243090 RepID=Q7US97_RHOBA|nr:hypothetical protein-signal peptide prediction [Rhodopirellula baltica SH 1]